MADRRAAAFPDVPTFREQGFAWSAGGWRGLALPRGVPRDRYEILVEAAGRVARSEGLRRFMDSNGFNTSIEGPREFAASLAASDAHFGEILTGEAFRPVRTSKYGPYVFPYALAGGLVAVVLGLLAVGGLRPGEDAEPITRGGLARVALAVAAIAAFVALMDEVGYVISAFALLLGLLLALRVRWPVALAVALVIAPLSYQVFAIGLRVPLPWGWLGW
jgi:hypothetical protein